MLPNPTVSLCSLGQSDGAPVPQGAWSQVQTHTLTRVKTEIHPLRIIKGYNCLMGMTWDKQKEL